MNVIGRHQMSIGVSGEEFSGYTVSSDEAIAKGTVKMIFEDLEKISPDNVELNHAVTEIQNVPFCLEKCKLALKLIQEHPLIIVVPDEENKDHSERRAPIAVWVRSIDINEIHNLVGLNEESVQALRMQEQTSIPFLSVAETAFKTLKRYTKTLERPQRISYQPTYYDDLDDYRTRYSPPKPKYTYRSQLLHQQKKDKCCCTIS